MFRLIIFIGFVAIAYVVGSWIEENHYELIKKREEGFVDLPAVTSKNALDSNKAVEKAEMVHGSTVVSLDYFKRLLAGLRNIFGGEVISYQTLIDRARREAILRMKESCLDADIILNLRLETSMIGQSADQRKNIGSIEVLAYGTAITYKK